MDLGSSSVGDLLRSVGAGRDGGLVEPALAGGEALAEAIRRAPELEHVTAVREPIEERRGEPLVAGEPTPVRVELFPVAYAFRAGTQIRLTIDAPGNNRPVWEFDTHRFGETVTIVHSDEYPSKIVLPVVSGVEVPAELPVCTSLRGQPCRQYAPADNGG